MLRGGHGSILRGLEGTAAGIERLFGQVIILCEEILPSQ